MATPTHKSLRVLFADDEKALQEFMRSELPRLGGIESELARMNRQFRSFVADIFQVRARVEKLEEDNDKRTA